MREFRLDDGRAVRLGKQLASAGEGVVSEVIGHPEWVAKIYHPHLPQQGLQARGRKVRAMAAAKPAGATQADGFVVLAWPEHALLGPDARVRGFVMRKIDTSKTVEVHSLSNPADRADPNPKGPQWPKKATWLHLVNVSRNLCRALDTAHNAGAVIGDFNERNILVADTTLVTLVDCDSFQFRSGSTVHPCGVARPEFLAPELAKVDLAKHVRDRSSDLFVLAIHIHLLLMAGNHPFSRGNWTGPGEKPEALVLAAGGHWAGGAQSRLKPHPAAPEVSMLPVAVRNLFERALGVGARQPAQRPSAAEWERALAAMTLVGCSRDKTHVYPNHNRSCPWCALASRQNGTTRTTSGPRPKTTVPKPGTRVRRSAAATVGTRPVTKTATATRPAATTTRATATTAMVGTKPAAGTTATAAVATTQRAATGPGAQGKPTPKRPDPVLAERRENDSSARLLTVVASLTCLLPWLLGHYVLRGNYLPVSGEVYDDEIRAWWPYFWAELRAGWALLWLAAGAFFVFRPWRGRWVSVATGVALAAAAIWMGPGAKADFAAAEQDSVFALSATAYPFPRYHTMCNSIDVGVRDAEDEPTHTMWQMYVYTDAEFGTSVCDHVAVYRGWTRVAHLQLPEGVTIDNTSRDVWVHFEETGETVPRGWVFWNLDWSRIWLNARTGDGRVVSTNLRDAPNGGLALR
ncbi:hypothetical protein [Nocardia higoensis]|uniref:hypothetical protein n=1 Tax=Nocardia higoensis TaxID=228599 RepID=UPI0003032695|nr:hypothetical protein [Nocardia higoensis]